MPFIKHFKVFLERSFSFAFLESLRVRMFLRKKEPKNFVLFPSFWIWLIFVQV